MSIDFNDTATTFASRSTADLRRTLRLFKSFGTDDRSRTMRHRKEALAAQLLKWHLPIGPFVRKLGFDHFYGGENLDQATKAVAKLRAVGVRTMLDYSVESIATEAGLDATRDEVLKVIALCRHNPDTPFTVFKLTALAREEVLEEASRHLENVSVSAAAGMKTVTVAPGLQQEFDRVVDRVRTLCVAAAAAEVRILIDAEHTWLQAAIDWIALHMMMEQNTRTAVIYTTIQMYRVGRPEYLRELFAVAQSRGFKPGIKLVRGAYMELERSRAESLGIPSPIQPSRDATDAAYFAGLDFCIDNIDHLALFAGTHSESSLQYLADLVARSGLKPNDQRIEVSQLLGMRDNASVMMAKAGFNVSKLVPYGPLRQAFPYLVRRANENSSVEGQVGREVELLERELERRAGAGHV